MQILAIVVAATVALGAIRAEGAPIDLNTFTVDNSLNFTGGQGAGNWNVNGAGTSVTQTVNGDPTLFLSPNDLSNSTISGTFTETDSDNDFIGFVFGFQSTGAFYLLDWKQAAQNDPFSSATAARGVTLKRIDGALTNRIPLWNTASTGVMTQLFHQDLGRSNGTTYTFDLTFTSPLIDITISQGAATLLNFSISDATYASGKFGFYNFSEDNATYTGFTADPAPPAAVPEPSTLVLLGTGLFGLACYRRRLARSSRIRLLRA